MRNLRPDRFRAGLTLPELLVCVAVIAILMAVLAPALSHARRSAMAAKCMSNERSAALTIAMYAGDWGDAVPFAGWQAWTIVAPGGREYRVGGVGGVDRGQWSLLVSDGWVGRDWNLGLRCPRQPRYDPDVAPGTSTSLSDGLLQTPMYSLSRAFWLDPRSLRHEAAWDLQRVRPARLGDVIFPSEKALLFEEIAFCVFGPRAIWEINEWGQTPYEPTSVCTVDLSAIRLPRVDGLPAAFTWPFDATIDGVLGRDIRR